MTTSNVRTAPSSKVDRSYRVAIIITTVFVFIQSFTAGEFISDGISGEAKEA